MLYLQGEDLRMKFQEKNIWINIESAACTGGKFAFEKEWRASFHLAVVITDSTPHSSFPLHLFHLAMLIAYMSSIDQMQIFVCALSQPVKHQKVTSVILYWNMSKKYEMFITLIS